MEFILVILAVILAVFFGWLLRQSLNTSPWIPDTVAEGAHQAPGNASAKTVALVMLLAVITSFFALILSAYAERMELGDWVPLTEPGLLWANTGMLVVASFGFQWTRQAAVHGRDGQLLPGMLVTGALSIGFVAGQYVAWRELIAAGVTLSGNPANAFFYLLTGAHALHIVGGLYVWARATARIARGAGGAAVRQSIELCAVYWHFLLLVWLILFGYLLST
jgi:cytochrome c oxidase subunit 3